jgi:hypothetical protein
MPCWIHVTRQQIFIFIFGEKTKCPGTKIKIQEYYRDQNQNSGILQETQEYKKVERMVEEMRS